MASVYVRGKTIYVKYKAADGSYDTVSRDENGDKFSTELKAKKWGNGKEEEIRKARHREAVNPAPPSSEEPEKLTFKEWADRWWPVHGEGLAIKTRTSYRGHLTTHLLPAFGVLDLADIKPLLVSEFLLGLRDRNYADNSVNGIRRLLALMLRDAAEEGLIDSNPAEQQRRRGKVVLDDHKDEDAEEAWPTALQALLIAERAALLAGATYGRTIFTLVLTKAYCGLRWGEVNGLTWKYVSPSELKVHWQLVESGKFYRQPPKYGSRRRIDLPPFLSTLLGQLHDEQRGRACICEPGDAGRKEQPCQGGEEHVFLGPKGGHLRLSNFTDRIWHPAVEGSYAGWEGARPRPSRPVMVDMAHGWPGVPVPGWPAAIPGEEFTVPRGHGIRVYDLEEVHLASWAPVLKGLTPHGCRHGQQTWLDDLAGVTEKLKKYRMGHKMRGVDRSYRHVSPVAQAAVKRGLQGLFEKSLVERFMICPTSPVPMLDALLRGVSDGFKADLVENV